jgi:hypothetical protein
MEKMLSPEQVAEIMSVSKRSAYDHMHRMPYMESPLRVKERDLREYIESRMVYPMPIKKSKRA